MAEQHYEKLVNEDRPVGERYQAVFELKSIGDENAIGLLMKAYDGCGSSVLLKHELLYALGQVHPDTYGQVREFLVGKVQDEGENNLSRHEAAEALANYFDESLQSLYEKYSQSTCLQLKWTCLIARQKLKNLDLKERYGTKYHQTKEPAAPFSPDEFKDFLQAEHIEHVFNKSGFLGLLCLQDLSLWNKYRTMYYMRDLNTEECRKVLCLLLSKEYFKTQTSLLKHEVCFVLGQIGCEGYEHLIRECIENEEEEDIVRHEALAAVASQSKDVHYLDKFVDHPSQLIRQSAIVAKHTILYWNQ